MKREEVILFSGGALGAEEAFGSCAESFGVEEVNFSFDGHKPARTRGLRPAVVIIAIFVWGTAFSGILGMLLAIPLTAFFVTAWRLARFKYLQQAPLP